MRAVLSDVEQANLLSLILHRLLLRAPDRPVAGTFRLRAGEMVARIRFGTELRIESLDGPAECSIEGSLGSFLRLALGASPLRAWLIGDVRLRGNPLKALTFLRLLRCNG